MAIINIGTVRDYKVKLDTEPHYPYVYILVKDKAQETYAELPTADELRQLSHYIRGNRFRVYLEDTYADCVDMKKAPVIPYYDGVTVHLNGTFTNCTALRGRVFIEAWSFQDGMFTGCPNTIYLCGDGATQELVDEIDMPNVLLWTAPSPAPTWATPVTDRTPSSRTTSADMNRLAGNTYLLGGHPIKCDYTSTDFVKDYEWQALVDDANTFAGELGTVGVTDSTSYTNLNRIELIHRMYRVYSE